VFEHLLAGRRRIRSRWQGFGLADCFDAHVTSRSTGYAKPSSTIFRQALKAIDVAPEAAAMIGDALDRDIAGAGAVGIRSIWVQRGPPHRSEPRPDAIIDSLTHLPAVLRSWIPR
jgi:putative hydrolase of the HAD superfamily